MNETRSRQDRRIDPPPVRGDLTVAEMLEHHFLAYNAGRLHEAGRVIREKMLPADGLVVLTISGALTPAGLGAACVVPLIENGLVDVIVSTGANLFHDLHHGLDLVLDRGNPFLDDTELRKCRKVRIYDIVMDFKVLDTTDWFIRDVTSRMPREPIGSAELHRRIGEAVLDRRGTGPSRPGRSILAVAARYDVPVYVAAPGDSAIGMNVAAQNLRSRGPIVDSARDVNELSAIIWNAKNECRRTGVIILGGGAPKNFVLQTAPHIEEVLYLERPGKAGFDYFVQITDARPDTGGLSGATPSEAVSWGKVLSDQLPDSVVCYLDATVAFPILTAAMLAWGRREPKRLYRRRAELHDALAAAYRAKPETRPPGM